MLEYDSAFRWPADEGNPTLELVVGMVGAGFGGRFSWEWTPPAGNIGALMEVDRACDFYYTSFVPRLREAGLGQHDIDAIFCG